MNINRIQEIIDRVSEVKNGFKLIEFEALQILNLYKVDDSKSIAVKLLNHEYYQVRSLAVFILGYIASKDLSTLQILKTKVGYDRSWQVQEILAKAFDQFCKDNGYKNSLQIIKEWLSDNNPNIARAVTEGLRIWTSRPYFKDNPEIAIKLISQHKANKSKYLRKSVGNSLRDISKKYKILVDKEVSIWDLSKKEILYTYKFVTKL